MATVEVISATSAFQDEKVEEPIKPDQVETNTKDVEPAQPTPAEPVLEVTNYEPAVAEADGAEAETLAAEVETKLAVDEASKVPEDELPVQGDSAAKVATEPEPEQKDTAEEAGPAADSNVLEGGEGEKKPADEAEVKNEAAEKFDE